MAVEGAVAAIAVALTAIGTSVAVYGAVEQGNAAKDAANQQKDAENANAQAAAQAAELEAGQIRRRNLLRLGSQRAAAAKSGVLIDDSAADVIYDTSIQGELEAMSALYSGATQAGYYRSRGKAAAAEGAAAQRAGQIAGAGTLIGGIGKGVRTAYPTLGRNSTD